jgi:hypothetical protein
MATSEVIWDSTPVPEKWIKTKEIPFREKIMPKETTVVKQDLSASINFNDVVKFCIHDHVDGSCKGFCEMNLHSQVALFYEHVLKTHPSTSNVFKGVYARNRLPRRLNVPSA